MGLIGYITRNISKPFIGYNARINGFHTSSARELIQDWRRENKLAENPNRFGPLTNLPDYSYADGRPAPFGVRQMGRINQQRDYLQQIKKLAAQVDFAVERHKRLEREKVDNRKRIIEGKLKPKGQDLLVLDTTKKAIV